MPKQTSKKMPDDFTEKFDMYMMAIKPRTKLNPNDVDELKRRFINYRKKTIEYGMNLQTSMHTKLSGCLPSKSNLIPALDIPIIPNVEISSEGCLIISVHTENRQS